MKQSQILQCITEFEKQYPIDQATFKGQSLWPLFRCTIISYLLKPRSVPSPRFSFIKRIIVALISPWAYRRLKKSFPPKTKAIYFEGFQSKKKIVKESIEQDLDPFFWSLKKSLKRQQIQLKNVFIPGLLYKFASRRFEKKGESSFNFYLKDIDLLAQSAASFFSLDEKLLKKYLISQCRVFFIRYYFYRNFLTFASRPRLFYLVYYFVDFLALNLAAFEKKLKTIEIQHGQQGRLSPHNIYHHIPASGYKLLPQTFWIWGSRYLSYKKFLTQSQYHDYFTGGHPVLNEFNSPVNKLVRNKKQIVFFGQVEREVDKLIPSFVQSALKKLQNSGYEVKLRLHPATLGHVDEIQRSLSFINNIKETSEVPLYDQLMQTETVITLWSSVAYEGNALGCKVILCSEIGKDHMGQDIDSGTFALALSADQIITAVQSEDKGPPIEDFIFNDQDQIEQNLSELVKS